MMEIAVHNISMAYGDSRDRWDPDWRSPAEREIQGEERTEETSTPENPGYEDKKQVILKLDRQTREAKERYSTRVAGRAEEDSKLEVALGTIGLFAGVIAGPALVFHYVHSAARDVLALYGGTTVGSLAGMFAGKYLGKFINYLRMPGVPGPNRSSKPCERDDSNRDDKADDNRTFSGTGYPG